MDLNVECDSSAMGSLFQQIIIDMKNTSPLWEDFVAKASKLHICLKAVIQAIASYLDAFQKIADAATNSRGASKEIGTALTRVCLRHKAVETRMKTFTSAIMDCLIIPLQDKIEDWKRQVIAIDKEHAKEYKKCRTELKKRSNDTLRLQKKARKDQSDTILSLVDSHMHDVSLRRAELEEVERKSLRAVMIEERVRFCTFVNMLQPVVKEECEVMSELGHLQEAMESIATFTKDPRILPQSSEEIIQQTKPSLTLYPESPGGGSLGSRKGSVCSINSVNSSGSSGSPSHHHYQRSLSQFISPTMQLKPGESSDSGFCSSPVLTKQSSATANQLHTVSTWPPHSQDVTQATDRPHTISSAYEKGHQRPPLTVYTFQKPETAVESQKSPASIPCRPPLPIRCSSLERPISVSMLRNSNVSFNQRLHPSPIPVHIAKELPQFQPTYANMTELASLSSLKSTNKQTHQLLQPSPRHLNSPNYSPASSQISSDSSIGNGHQLHSSSDSLLSAITHSGMSAAILESTITYSNENLSPIISQTIDSTHSYNNCKLNVERSKTTDTSTEISSEEELKIIETDIITNDLSRISSSNKVVLSPESCDISRASVQQKASLFERLEREQNANNNSLNVSSNRSSHNDNNSVHKKEEIYKIGERNETDSEKMYEDSIKELNNLIGELDSFQREHDPEQRNNFEKDHSLVGGKKLQIAVSTDGISDEISTGSYCSSAHSLNKRYINCVHSPNTNECVIQMEISRPIDTKKNINDNAKAEPIMSKNGVDLTFDEYNIEYLRENSAVVVLRCKEPRNSIFVDNKLKNNSQRLSSFHFEQMGTSSQADINLQIERESYCALVEGCAARMTRRSSSNNIKPPPPVRRSSSVTPSLNTHTPGSLIATQNNALNVSAENLPPPPAFLLDRAGNDPIPVNVAETVKALTVIKHTPASPTILRRAQSQQLQTSATQIFCRSSPPSLGVYAQPKQITKMSSFRSPNLAPQKSGLNIMSHINARHFPHKQSDQLNQSNAAYKSNMYQQHQLVHEVRSSQQPNFQKDVGKNEGSYSEEAKKIVCWNDKQLSQESDDYTAAGNIHNKSKAEFLHNLNMKLAKQELSGRAFAVRNLINNKALPDPRVCHESLMDQIKRGATLKHNRTINDRSAPKIR